MKNLIIINLLSFLIFSTASAESEIVGLSEKASSLSGKRLQEMKKDFDSNPINKRIQNAVTVTNIDRLVLDREIVNQNHDSFSKKLDDWKVTNQKHSGRCWLFASTNLLRVGAAKKMNMKDFEFSQNYVFFWDKLEKANYFLESIIDTAAKPDGDRLVDYLLSTVDRDGGQWNMFVSLVKKHGLVPKVFMPETDSTSNTFTINRTLRLKLRQSAKSLRTMYREKATPQQLNEAKNEMINDIYRILCLHFGTPPEKFYWQWRDKDNEFHRDGEMTPQQFVKKYVTLNLDDYVCLINDPRPSSPFGRTFTVAYLGNVVAGEPIRYLNIDIELMKTIAMKMLLADEPVWFGCDTTKQMDRETGLWDSKLLDYEGLYGTKIYMSKADRLIYGQSQMNHAMLFTGVDIVDDNPTRWRVENSWGDDTGQNGFFTMNDSWFNEYVLEIVVPKKYLSKKLQQALEQEPIILMPWDPMGALAE